MKKFKDIRTGVIHEVSNEKLVAGYENHQDIYVEVKEKEKKEEKEEK